MLPDFRNWLKGKILEVRKCREEMEQDLLVAVVWVVAWYTVKAAAWDEEWVLE